MARGDEVFRTYRISRVVEVDVLAETFDQFDRRRDRGVAVLRLSRDGLDRLPGLLGTTAAAEPGADGWTEVTIPVDSVETALPELRKLGADVEVVSPGDLRERIIATVRAMNRVYGVPDG